jgi:hypothetical protein
MPSWRGAQLKKHRDNFTFTPLVITFALPVTILPMNDLVYLLVRPVVKLLKFNMMNIIPRFMKQPLVPITADPHTALLMTTHLYEVLVPITATDERPSLFNFQPILVHIICPVRENGGE